VRNAVNNDCVGRRLIEYHAARVDEFRNDPFHIPGIDTLNQCSRECIFQAKQNSDSFHAISLGFEDLALRGVGNSSSQTPEPTLKQSFAWSKPLHPSENLSHPRDIVEQLDRDDLGSCTG
jgi:hypothetical protein